MEMSDQINELATALSAFQGEMKVVTFDSVNPFFKSKYASLSALVSKASPLLAKNGLSVSQIIEDDGWVLTILAHKSGQYMMSRCKLPPTKQDCQGILAAVTYTRRGSYSSILGLVSDEDLDGNNAVNGHGNGAAVVAKITKDQLSTLRDLLIALEMEKQEDKFAKFLNTDTLENLPAIDYQKALSALNAKMSKREAVSANN